MTKIIYHLVYKAKQSLFGLVLIYFTSLSISKYIGVISKNIFSYDVASSYLHWSTLFIFVILFLFYPHEYNHRHVFKKKKHERLIKEYMFDWIGEHSKVIIFTNDLSWVVIDREDKLYKLFIEKKNDITVCAPSNNSTLSDLKRNGINVILYNSAPPEIRYTIVDYGILGSKVAIGYSQEKYHIIEEYDDKSVIYKFAKKQYESVTK